MSDDGTHRLVVRLRWWALAVRLALPLVFLTLAASFAIAEVGGGRWLSPIVATWAALAAVAAAVVIVGAPRITLCRTHLSWRAYGRGWSIPWETCGEFRVVAIGIGKEVVAFDTTAPVRPGWTTADAAREAKADMTLGEGMVGWRIGARDLRLVELADLLNTYRRNAPR